MPECNQPIPDQPNNEVRRDARGRWLKGSSPNPRGRAPKEVFKDYSPSDVRHFANTLIELTVNGQPEKMDRRAALLNKVFESAMSGKVSQQRPPMSKCIAGVLREEASCFKLPDGPRSA